MARPEGTTAEQWLDAAYDRFGEHGLSAVRIEPLATQLGTTKGSFYWHYSGRPQLIAAVMQRWEERETQQAIEIAEASGSAEERLRALFDAVAARTMHRREEATLYVEAQSEGVTDVIERVTRQRVAYIAGLLVELGFDPDEAERRGALSLALVLGLLQLGEGTRLPMMRDPRLTETAYAMALAQG